ncbi:ABC transporter substrate-binding protein [Geodermatophilus sabuli]|uniref:ABC transporter substrate-binding protein n=1 Tax=Geodermatophilus sabuli TaxID=1564158 RepID=A0A7K3W056_9ACTN|nr:ABC transporter substrate-binding protein [Geodermatophilus sabuli]NEK58255.1 ABC transporter substrate-binding protein [Geodermatophilus sabuli]
MGRGVSTRRRSRRSTVALALAAATALTGCGGEAADSGGSGGGGGGGGGGGASGAAADVGEATVVLGFTASPNFASIFSAVEQGYCEEEGVEVTIMPGGPGVEGEQLVANGQADFVLGGLPDTAVAVQEGLPLVAVAARDTLTEFGLVTSPDSGIEEPADLEGKSVALSQFATPTTLFGPFLSVNDVPADSVQVQTVAGPAVTSALLSGQVDAAGGGASTLLGVRDEMPDAGFLAYSDLGLDVLGAGLVTRQDLVEEDPDLVDAVVDCFVRGLEFTVENPEDAVEDVRASYPAEIGAFSDPVAILEFVNQNVEAPYGVMPPELWESSVQVMADAGALDDPSDPEQYYTNEFVENE